VRPCADLRCQAALDYIMVPHQAVAGGHCRRVRRVRAITHEVRACRPRTAGSKSCLLVLAALACLVVQPGRPERGRKIRPCFPQHVFHVWCWSDLWRRSPGPAVCVCSSSTCSLAAMLIAARTALLLLFAFDSLLWISAWRVQGAAHRGQGVEALHEPAHADADTLLLCGGCFTRDQGVGSSVATGLCCSHHLLMLA